MESRHNTTLAKGVLKEIVASKMSSLRTTSGGMFTVQLANPHLTILIQVIKNVCGVSAIFDYDLYKRGNLQLMCDAFIDSQK